MIQKIRLDDVLYMNFKNDISFGVGGKVMVFGEHQSTINENMPLRSLLYIGRAYEQIISVRDRYKRKQVKLPKPEFYTFYNGTQSWGKEKMLYLSEAYQVQEGNPMLELAVKVININPEEHHELLDKCPVLKEYGLFVNVVREHQAKGDVDAYKHAVEECMDAGILAEYLKKKGSEVVNMLMAEYDYDLDIEVQREEAYRQGEKAGKALGEAIGEARGKQQGEHRVNQLIEILIEKGRSEEIAEMVKDLSLQQKLFDEFDL